MKTRVFLVLALLLSFALPTATFAKGPPPTGYERTEQPLAEEGAVAVYETIVLDGALTPEMRTSTDLAALAANPGPAAKSTDRAAAAAQTIKTIGRQFTAWNGAGMLVIQYTVWQTFGYDGSNITYTPAPTYSHQANWGWTLKSHSESAWWVTAPTYRTSRGNFYFKQEVWSPFGNIGLSEKSGWVQVYYRGNGSWSAANS